MIKNTEEIQRVVACNYRFSNSCILLGAVTKERELIVLKQDSYTEKAAEEIAKILEEYNLPVWINRHAPLEKSLDTRVNQVDLGFREELEQLTDFFSQLKHQNRIFFNKGINIQSDFQIEAVKILIKALLPDLCSNSSPRIFFARVERPRWQRIGF